MPKLRSAPQEAHRKAVESSTPDVVGYLQEVLVRHQDRRTLDKR
jgi:hypothetical protein